MSRTTLLILILLAPSMSGQSRFGTASRRDVLERAAAEIEAKFYDADGSAEIASTIRQWRDDGHFDRHSDPASFARALMAKLLAFDRHLLVSYQAPGLTSPTPAQPVTPDDPMRRRNFGIRTATVLPGNVGYLDFHALLAPEVMGPRFGAALQLLSDTDAMILDVRNNTGGLASTVAFIISHFLDPEYPVLISALRSRDEEREQQFWSLRHLAAPARPEVPLYVLTSARTISAAEGLAYHLQAMERATIVGRTTAGAGNAGKGFHDLGHGFALFIPMVQTVDPHTGTGWERVGLEPDLDVPADQALDTALVEIYDQLLDRTHHPDRRRTLEWGLECVEARLDPVILDASELTPYVGTYGRLTIQESAGGLWLEDARGDVRRLRPVSRDRFVDGDPEVRRYVFERSPGARMAALRIEQDLVGLQVERHPRTAP